MWTGRIARVRSVIFDSICRTSRSKVSGSMSTKTGIAPCWRIGWKVPANVYAVVMTSSPGWTPTA